MTIWPDKRLADLLGITHPIIQAPMLGTATPELAAAVSNAGGLGSLAFGVGDAAAVQAACDTMRGLTNAAFNLNFFVLPEASPASLQISPEMQARLQPYYDGFGLGPVAATVPKPAHGPSEAVIAVLLDRRPAVVSFHFGLPEAGALARLRAAGVRVLCSATCVAEAVALERAGVDAVIAQGWEAGGHRGSHALDGPGDGVGTMALVPQVVDAVRLPVIAAGGIGDGRGIAAAFALGACGVQIGTAFSACPEAATDAPRRALLRTARDTDTMVTDAVSGRSARALRSPYAVDVADLAGKWPPYEAMYALSGPIEDASSPTDGPVSFHLYGQAAALSRELAAAELLAVLVAEAQARFRALRREV